MVTSSAILGLGAHRPATVVTNDDLTRTLDTNDAWIRDRTGITERRVASADETVVEMAVSAGGKALAASGLAPDSIDLVIVATCSLDQPLPGAAAAVATGLAIPAPGAFDINAACAGFCYGLSLARDAIASGSARAALVIGSERLSSWVDWDDRGTAILFGDGAGAAVVGPAPDGVEGIGPVVWGSDGSGSELIAMHDGAIEMQGQAVFRWASSQMVPIARKVCAAAGLALEDVDAFVPHQANGRIVSSMARSLGLSPRTVVADDVTQSGNTSSASIPLALARLQEEGSLAPGSTALLLGFGSGLTYAGQVIRMP